MNLIRVLKVNLLIWLAVLSLSVEAAGLKSEAISPALLDRALNSQVPPQVVDVRSPDEYSSGHIPGARSIPFPLLAKHLDELRESNGLVLYCNDSRLTRMAENILLRKKVTEFKHLEGGLRAWTDAELPIETSLD